jgi:hypothetical protein
MVFSSVTDKRRHALQRKTISKLAAQSKAVGLIACQYGSVGRTCYSKTLLCFKQINLRIPTKSAQTG